MRSVPHYQGRVSVSVAPINQPISLADVKAHMRITTSDEDTYLQLLIDGAIEIAQDYMGRKLITQTLEAYYDTAPGGDRWWDGMRDGSISEVFGGAARTLELAWMPVQSVSSIKTYDDDDTESLFAASKYYVDTVDQNLFARVSLRDGETWPTDLRHLNAIKVTYIAGYGDDATDVPAAIRLGLLNLVGFMYSNRGDCGMDPSATISAAGLTSALERFRVQVL